MLSNGHENQAPESVARETLEDVAGTLTADEAVMRPALLARLRALVSDETQPIDALVPVEDFPLYYLLASEIARTAAHEGGDDLVVVVDSHTASQVDAVDAARAAAKNVYVFGPLPQAWEGLSSVTACPAIDRRGDSDLFLVALSSQFAMAIVCDQSAGVFTGAWTAQRCHVLRACQILLTWCRVSLPVGLMAPLVRDEDVSIACGLRLTSLMIRQLKLRQRDIAMDKDDLFNVLNILKAISAKRRAHDILYVFVEQIARAIQIDRCSVVRVWGLEDKGHVLASHESPDVSNLQIDLARYPEIRRVMETHQKVVVNDTRRDPLTRPCAEELARANIHALVVIPVVLYDHDVGSFFLRAARRQGSFSLREISFCEIVAEAAAKALERAQLFENIQRANERLEYLAVTDGLTGLYNHRHFLQRLEEEFVRARRYDLPVSCMIMDVDNFKRVNDTYGHLHGDTVLQGIATCLQQAVRKSDIVARYGGEEFVVIMPQTGLEGAKAQAERIRRGVGEWVFKDMPEGFRATISIGVAVFNRATTADSEALIRRADGALYRAKREGKNRVCVGGPEEET